MTDVTSFLVIILIVAAWEATIGMAGETLGSFDNIDLYVVSAEQQQSIKYNSNA